ncbi:hypothetical protein IAT38_003437 [Cryptococcus sp. DSM 104549]
MLKDIVERPSKAPSAPAPPRLPTPGSTGFPVAQHRSSRPSAFARARRDQQTRQAGQLGRGATAEGRAVDAVPPVQTEGRTTAAGTGKAGTNDEWADVKESVERENSARVSALTEEEREQEVADLTERFGEGIMEKLRKRALARATASTSAPQAASGSSSSVDALDNKRVDPNDTRRIMEEVSEENRRRVEEMSVQERQQEAEELQERFGSKMMEALRKRAEARLGKGKERDVDAVQGSAATDAQTALPPGPSRADDDISLAALKEKYFPTLPSEPSKLEWLQPITEPSNDKSTRFDLSGNVLTDAAKADLPVHLGLHHHGTSPDLAGYTMEDILYLCRSTVPSQRITMMGVLGKVLSKLRQGKVNKRVQKECEEIGVVQQAIDLGVEVLAGLTRGVGVIRASVDLLFEALGVPEWSFPDDTATSSYQPFIPTPLSQSAEPLGLAAIPFEDVLPRLTELLSIADGLSPETTHQLILILRRTTLLSSQLCETICPIVPAIVKQHVVQRSWPPKGDRRPSVDALRLLRDITASSRACAEDLLSQGVYETTLKFIITATWSEDEVDLDVRELGQELALEVFRTYAVLGRYGFGASAVTSSAEIWRRFGAWVRERPATLSRLESALVRAYLDLLGVWTVCAVDPHRTTPEHDVTWAQVSALGWAEEAIGVVKAAGAEVRRSGELVSALNMLACWAEGLRVNGVKGGEEEKKQLLQALQGADLGQVVEKVKGGEAGVMVLGAAVRIHVQLQVAGELLEAGVLAHLREKSAGLPASRAATYLNYHLLRLDIQSGSASPTEWLPSALSLFQAFQVGDEPLALELVDDLIKADWSSSSVAPQLVALPHPDRLQVLRPLLTYTILPDVENVVAPYHPFHLYIKATASLRAPAPTGEQLPRIAGLPLQPDWLFSPLNELLRSGTSTALAQVPPDWSASETEIVQAVLMLGQLQLACPGWEEGLGRSRVLFNTMKVFMLEHGQQSTTSAGEVFRDKKVGEAMGKLMAPLLTSPALNTSLAAPLETISLPFLGAGVPFFQFYADFVALYEAISFSDTLFTQLLLPSLAMSYPLDYRKLLWNDHSTALRGMRVSLSQVPLETPEGIKAFFGPRESSAEVLSGYARALVRGWVVEERNEFLFKVAVHHLAALFWEGKEEGKESTRVGLLISLLSTGSEGLVKRVLEWDLGTYGAGVVGSEEKEKRRAVVGKLTGVKGTRRVESL